MEDHMSQLVTLPDDVFEKARQDAAKHDVSVDTFVTSALVQQILLAEHRERRHAKSTPETFRRALESVPDVEPEEYDRL